MPAVYAALLMLTISQADCSITKSVSRRRFLFVRCMNNFHNSTERTYPFSFCKFVEVNKI